MAESRENSVGGRRIIQVAGDISDIDGMYALHLYGASGADVMWVMNYPAYIAQQKEDPDFERKMPGLGFRYGCKELLEVKHKGTPGAFEQLMRERYPHGNLTQAMTDVAFELVTSVWRESGAAGKLFFAIGGVNAVNPFSKTAIKNEVAVYAPLLLLREGDAAAARPQVACVPGTVYDIRGDALIGDVRQLINTYDRIYLDLTGSAAGACFPSLHLTKNVRAAVVMNGVRAFEAPQTLPSIPGTLNRLSAATMNGLYHPQRTGEFYDFCSVHGVPVYAVTNNAVHDLAVSKGDRSTARLLQFLRANGVEPGPTLLQAIELYYGSGYAPPIKAFDAYAALALLEVVSREPRRPPLSERGLSPLFFDRVYGLALVAEPHSTWGEAVNAYCGSFTVKAAADDDNFAKTKKQQLLRETERLRLIPIKEISELLVRDVAFALDPATLALSPGLLL